MWAKIDVELISKDGETSGRDSAGSKTYAERKASSISASLGLEYRPEGFYRGHLIYDQASINRMSPELFIEQNSPTLWAAS